MDSRVFGDPNGLSILLSGKTVAYESELAEVISEFKRRFFDRLGPEFVKRLRINTPVLSGLLRDSWTYHSTGVSLVASSGVPYAYIPEYGYYKGLGPRTVKGSGGGIYSSQAPEGISGPTIADIEESNLIEMLAAEILEEILSER